MQTELRGVRGTGVYSNQQRVRLRFVPFDVSEHSHFKHDLHREALFQVDRSLQQVFHTLPVPLLHIGPGEAANNSRHRLPLCHQALELGDHHIGSKTTVEAVAYR